MTIREARKIERDFNEKSNPSEEDAFLYTEAMDFLITRENNPKDMLELGGYYYEERRFDLALKYYEMAATFDVDAADECLGYIWYYGRTGERDYKKAFEYYSRSMKRGNMVCAYKVADMYKNGHYVEKDYEKYKEIIEDLYPKVKDAYDSFAPLPEIFTRLARIRVEQNRKDEAIALYEEAKDFLAERISQSAFFGNLNIMKWLIDDLYELVEFDKDDFDFFDLYYLLKTPNKISFTIYCPELVSGRRPAHRRRRFSMGRLSDFHETYTVESVEEDGAIAIRFGDKWYRDRDDFFAKACIDDDRLTSIFDFFEDFEVC